MTSDLVEFLANYRGRGLLLDANLLLVFTIGLQRPMLIAKHKRTSGRYYPEDFGLLLDLMEFFDLSIVTTPHVLTEVSNLLRLSPESLNRDLFKRLADVIVSHKEHQVPSHQIITSDHFADFGLTDLAILAIAAREKALVITDDARFADYLRRKHVDVAEFRFLRDLNES